MSTDKMDQYFKENLQVHETPLDTNALWESIAPEVVEEKKFRKWFIIWFFGAGIVLLGLGVWSIIGMENNKGENIKAAINENQNRVEDIEICNENEEAILMQAIDNESDKDFGGLKAETSSLGENKNNTKTTSKGNIDNVERTTPNLVQSNESNDRKLPKTIASNTVYENGSTRDEVVPKTGSNDSKIIDLNFTQLKKSQKGNKDNNDEEKLHEKLNTVLYNQISITENNEKGITVTENTADKKAEFMRDTKDGGNVLVLENENRISNILRPLPTLKSLLSIPITILDLQLFPLTGKEIENFALAAKEEEKKNPKPKNKSQPFSIAFYATPSISMRQFTANTNDTLAIIMRNKAFLERRKSSETSLESFNVGLLFNWHHSAGFYMGSGLQYGQINEKFTYYNQTKWIEHSAVAVDSIYTRTITKEIYNRFKMIDIPLFVGYEFGKKKWRYSIEAGALLNLSLRSTGQIFGIEENIFEKYDEINNAIYKKNIGMSFTGNVGIRRKLSDNWSIGTQVGVRYFPKSFTLENNALQQHYMNIGLKVKCAYRF